MEQAKDPILISSALECTWPQEQPVVFLGEWCLRFSRRHVWSSLDYSISPYHWDDRSKIPEDLKYVEDVYERLLPELAGVLNDFHGVDYSLRYWRIVVGWWLFYFAQIFFDRWQVIQEASTAYPHSRMLRMPAESQFRSSNDTMDFINVMSTDWWNERLMADIAESWSDIRVQSLDDSLGTKTSQDEEQRQIQQTDSFQRFLLKSIAGSADWFGRQRSIVGPEVILTGDQLRLLDKVKVAIKLRQLPVSGHIRASLPTVAPDPDSRKFDLGAMDGDPFLHALARTASDYLPACFLEGYEQSVRLAKRMGPSQHAKVIMTNTAFADDDLWKLWAGFHVEQGAKLIVGQHGGHYGTGAWSPILKHEIAMSDRYLSWGWTDFGETKVKPAPATKLIGLKRQSFNKDGRCLQVVASMPRQSYWIHSGPAGPQFENYLADQHRFASALTDEVRESLIVRLYPIDYGWDFIERWNETDPLVAVEPGIQPMAKLWRDTKLFIATYNATTFLESFTLGIPTVMFWDPKFWQLSDDSQPFFNSLRKAKVFFTDAHDCADHVNEIWSDVGSWWYSSQVQDAVNTFSNHYAYVGPKPLTELVEALTAWT